MSENTNISGGGRQDPFKRQEPVGDFFAPFFTVKFQTYDRESFAEFEGTDTLDIGVDSGGLVSFADDRGNEVLAEGEDVLMNQLRSYITSLEVVSPSESQSYATITIEPPFYAAVEIIDNQLIQLFSIMVIQWGYLNSATGDKIASDVHFFMVSAPELEMSGSDVTVRIRGADLFGVTSARRESRRDWPRSFYKTDLAILRALASKNGMTIRDRPGVPDVALFETSEGRIIEGTHPLRQNKLFTAGIVDVVHQDTKDWIFFNRLCRQNNVSFFVLGEKIFLIDMNTAKTQQPQYHLLYYQQPSGPHDIPMYSFSSNANKDLFIPAEAAETRAATVDPDDGEVIEQVTDPLRSAVEQHTGARSASGTSVQDGRVLIINNEIQVIPQPLYADDETGAYYTIPFGEENREEKGRQPARRASLVGNTKATATIPGNPFISPLMIVRVAGVGRVFGGNYLITKATHRLSFDGYDTELELIRDSTTGDPVAGKGERPATGANDKSVQNNDGEEVQGVSPDEA